MFYLHPIRQIFCVFIGFRKTCNDSSLRHGCLSVCLSHRTNYCETVCCEISSTVCRNIWNFLKIGEKCFFTHYDIRTSEPELVIKLTILLLLWLSLFIHSVSAATCVARFTHRQTDKKTGCATRIPSETIKQGICPIILDFRKSIVFWKVPRLRSFVLARAKCWRWTCSIGGAILTAEHSERLLSQCHFVHNKSNMIGPEIELGPAQIKYENWPESYLNIQLVPRSKHISSGLSN